MTSNNRKLAFDKFCHLLKNSQSPKVRFSCARSLGKLRYKEAIPLLFEIAENEQENEEVRLAALSSIEEILMPKQSKNKPLSTGSIVNIQQVGNINTGDVEIKGDQIGIQPSEDSQ